MKGIFVGIIAVLMLVASATADVTITASGDAVGYLKLAYTSDAGDELVGLALVLDCGMGGDMIDVSAGSYTIDSFFDVFIDAYYTIPGAFDDFIFYDDATTPFADPDGPGQVVANAAKVSLCIAALKNPPAGGPAANPLALIKVIDGDGDFNVTVTITLDSLRGGGVDLEGSVVTHIVGSPVTTIVSDPGCFYPTPGWEEWLTLGAPDCWCYPRQCHGDADGKANKVGQWVDTNDLNILKAAWLKMAAELTGNDICADFDRKANKIGQRVDTTDLNILKQNWLQTTTPPDCPGGGYILPLSTATDTTEECYAGMLDYHQWKGVGKPICWCYPRQCHGDADGKASKAGQWVDITDLHILKRAWLKSAEQFVDNDGCADFDHLGVKTGIRVESVDLWILKSNWLRTTVPPDCLPGNRTP